MADDAIVSDGMKVIFAHGENAKRIRCTVSCDQFYITCAYHIKFCIFHCCIYAPCSCCIRFSDGDGSDSDKCSAGSICSGKEQRKGSGNYLLSSYFAIPVSASFSGSNTVK